MGTNYYEIIPACEYCESEERRLHIGKSSAGWPFSVHVIEEMGLLNWAAWYDRLFSNNHVILNEYGDDVTLQELNDLVIGKRIEADKQHVLDCYRDFPSHSKPCPDTGDRLISGEFC